MLSRRDVCAFLGLTTAQMMFVPYLFGKGDRNEIPDLASLDRQRILAAATRYITEKPLTITSVSSSRSAGDKHDYFSEGDYWWPNPRDPSGPYIQRDGVSNPNNFNQHRLLLIRLSVQVPALTAAWVLTRDKRFAQHAVEHLRAWFIDPETLMNPNLQYAQAIHGLTAGRSIGIIDTLHFVEVVHSIRFLTESKQLSLPREKQLRRWFSDYLEWMTTSPNGKQERDAKNNHGTCWALQAAEFARFVENQVVLDFCRERFKKVIVPNQIGPDGSFPLELRRTKPYGYCIFNLDVMATLCQVLSSSQDDLFRFALSDGRGFTKAMAFMFPFIKDKTRWPYARDVEHFEDWPVRQPSLLFAGIALSQPEYFKVWRRLNPDPTVPEIIRNYPVRQPILWVGQPNV